MTKGIPMGMSSEKVREELQRPSMDFEGTSDLLHVVGNTTRLKILFLLDDRADLRVPELAEMLRVSVSAVSQHLSKLKAHGLVAPKRAAQTTTYRLTSHPFADKLRESFFRTVPESSSRPPTEKTDAPIRVPLQELHDDESGRLDAARIAEFLKVPLKRLAEALGRSYPAVHKTPDAPSLQEDLRRIKRSLEILEQTLGDRSAVLAWWNNSQPDLGGRTPLEVLLEGHPDAIHDMLEAALAGTPS